MFRALANWMVVLFIFSLNVLLSLDLILLDPSFISLAAYREIPNIDQYK
jgi:hypothetical protein